MPTSTPYQKLRRYTLWSLSGLIVVLPAGIYVPLLMSGLAYSVLLGAVFMLETATAAILAWRGVDIALEKLAVPRVLVALHAVLGVLAVVLVWVAPSETIEMPAVIIPVTAVLCLVPAAIMLPMGYSVGFSVIVALLAFLFVAPDPGVAPWDLARFVGAVALLSFGMFASFRGSVWILQLTREEATTAAIKADLAVAQERLRFSRDLHDIFGRTLTAVAVKSDLAAELADHGRAEQAAAEMRAVNELAQQAITEVRGVVSAMRTPELTTELSGARALLTSSGTQVRIVGDAADARYPDVMGWIVREAVTNIIRHSQATWCEIFVEPCSLRVVNDGADVPARDSRLDHAGSGLRGLEDRVRHTGGHLSVESAGGIFTLRARWEE